MAGGGRLRVGGAAAARVGDGTFRRRGWKVGKSEFLGWAGLFLDPTLLFYN